jgi:hypothetical protein
MTQPERPPAVPAGAVFEPESAVWELYEHDETGARHGAFTTFRADGVLLTRGSYQSGQLDGAVSRFTTATPGAPTLRPCCVPSAARELRTTYRRGRVLHEVFYDEQGWPLCDDGTPWPARPEGLPSEAIYDDLSLHFVLRREGDAGLHTIQLFNVEGWLEEEIDSRGFERVGRRRFAPDGTCTEETPLKGERQPHTAYVMHGAYIARVPAGDESHVDARIRELRGEHEQGEPVGSWELRDAAGTILRRVDFGPRLATPSTPLVSGSGADRHAGAEELWASARDVAERSPREGVALAARALAKGGESARFLSFLGERSIGLAPDIARARAEEAVTSQQVSASSLLGAMLAGATPAMALRRLATLLSGDAPAALDYFDASLCLQPEQDMKPLARGLIAIEQGDPGAAIRAAQALWRESEQAGALLAQFSRITYDAFPFRPDVDGVTIPDEELVALELTQPLAAVRRTIGLYATRLGLVRRELARRAGGEPGWLPPETSALLPEGPVELRRFTARIEDEGENGPEVSEVEVDETLDFTRSTRELMQVARSDWAALGWLCWSVGLDAIGLPERIAQRETFVAAMHQATLRCWRAHDRVRSEGLVALARKVPGFQWEGMAIDGVPPHLNDTVSAEYLEVRAQFLWLMYEQNPSPFQRDLRVV